MSQDDSHSAAEVASKAPIPHAGSSLAQLGPQGGRIVAEMVSGSLAMSGNNAALVPSFSIGSQVFCEPDYRQILLWAKAMELTPEEVLARLLAPIPKFEYQPQGGAWGYDNNTTITGGRLIRLAWPVWSLPLKSFEWVPGLIIESWIFWRTFKLGCGLALSLPKLQHLYCGGCGFTELDLSAVPELTVLSCDLCPLTELDLSAVPLLTELECYNNQLTELDLSPVPMLTKLGCDYNQLTELDLSGVPMLTELGCGGNQLTELDLSTVPLLTKLSCAENRLIELDLSAVPMITNLFCHNNQLTELDIRPLLRLNRLSYDKEKTRLIQRPDQQF